MLQPPSAPHHLTWSYTVRHHTSVSPLFLEWTSHSLCLLSLFTLHAGPFSFSFLWLFPKRPSLLSPQGCGLGERAASLGRGPEGRKKGCSCGRAAVDLPTVGLTGEALREVWKEQSPQHRTGIDRWGGHCRPEEKRTPGSPAALPHTNLSSAPLVTSLPPMTCLTLVHQTIFCLWPFMQFIKVVMVSLCLALALGACPRGKYILLGDQEERPSAAFS